MHLKHAAGRGYLKGCAECQFLARGRDRALINQTRRKYRERYPERVKEAERSRDRDKVLAKNRRWYANNREVYYANNRKRRARMYNAEHTPWSRQQVWEQTKGVCYLCLSALDGSWHVDHVVPISRGGRDSLDNLLPACASCNASKKDNLLEEWVA